MMKIKKILKKNKFQIMYITIFILIGYFQIDILTTLTDMTEKELNIPINNKNFNFNEIPVINYNQTYSSYIRIISMDFLQIIMLILLFIRIYVPETAKNYGIK